MTAFLAGNALAWNPFVLTAREKVFFLYHLCDIDRVTAHVIRELGGLDDGVVLELRDAGRVVCSTLHKVLDAVEGDLRASDLPLFRTARELAVTMAEEMDLGELASAHGTSRAKLRPGSRALISAAHHSQRKTTKNTDHQTVPRLEQLADLGFVRKDGVGFERDGEPRRRWRWAPTDEARRWRKVTTDRTFDTTFLWSGFARAAKRSLGEEASTANANEATTVARWAFDAYRMVRRTVGHTPLDSVALVAMIEATAAGIDLEMERVHRLMTVLKRSSTLSEYVQFAGGNALDEMFIRLRDGFVEQVARLEEAGAVSLGLEGAAGEARARGSA